MESVIYEVKNISSNHDYIKKIIKLNKNFYKVIYSNDTDIYEEFLYIQDIYMRLYKNKGYYVNGTIQTIRKNKNSIYTIHTESWKEWVKPELLNFKNITDVFVLLYLEYCGN